MPDQHHTLACHGHAGADIVIRNAAVFTADARRSLAQAVAVTEGKISYVGGEDGAAACIGPRTRVIDLGGGSLLPGMVDAHAHILSGGQIICYQLRLTPDMRTVADYQAALTRFMTDHPDMECYTGFGFMPTRFPGDAPRKEYLDAVCPHIPVCIRAFDGHSTWVNSKALELAGVTRHTPDPSGGVIVRDADGEATGLMLENAGIVSGGTLERFRTRYTREENKKAILAVQDYMLARGVTTMLDAAIMLSPEAYMAYEELAREGKLRLKIRGVWLLTPALGGEDAQRAIIDTYMEISRTFRTPYFQVTGFKMLADMVLENATSYMLEPYLHRHDNNHGMRIWPDSDMLARLIAHMDTRGFHLHVHQMGDAAARYMLDAFEGAAAQCGGLTRRHAFSHCQFITDTDKARMARLGISAIVAPYWFETALLWNNWVPFIGLERALRAYPAQSLIDAGINVAVHSDYLVSNPDWGALLVGYMARTLSRPVFEAVLPGSTLEYTTDPTRPLDPRVLTPLPPASERVSLDDALVSATINGAYALECDDRTGSIEVGKDADMVAFAQNVHTLHLEELGAITPLFTLAGGIEYSK